MDTDEDSESEMEFWGGESPRSRLTSPNVDNEMAIDDDSEDSEDEDGDDSADESMSDDAEEDEADKYNRMDIFGHR